MKTLYLDLFSGISGDMFLGALIDLGADERKLERELKKLKLHGYHLHVSRQQRQGIAGVKFDVHLAHEHQAVHSPAPHEHDSDAHHCGGSHFHRGHEHSHAHDHDDAHAHAHDQASDAPHHHEDQRTFTEIQRLITHSTLSRWVKTRAIAVFRRIAEAEGKIHGLPPEQVHFHEVGAVDSIVDIVGACLGLELLGKPRVLASPVVEGVGWISCAHGRFPIPAPATLAILGARGIGITQCDEPHELVTPTGAALLAEFVEDFSLMSGLVAGKIGFGLGTRENKTRPNVLRAVLGKVEKRTSEIQDSTSHIQRNDWEMDRIAVLETNLDDMTGEVLGHFVEQALAAGALDVFHTPIQMKKNRPGVLLTVLCAEADADRFSEMLLRETTAFGVRRTLAERRKLRRESTIVKTRFGNVTLKLGKLNGRVVQASPEYESCRHTAAKAKVPLKQVYDAVIRAVKASDC